MQHDYFPKYTLQMITNSGNKNKQKDLHRF